MGLHCSKIKFNTKFNSSVFVIVQDGAPGWFIHPTRYSYIYHQLVKPLISLKFAILGARSCSALCAARLGAYQDGAESLGITKTRND